MILGMEAPPNLGATYASRFRDVYPELARKYDAGLVEFVLDSVVAEPSLNIDDGIHPNADGHRVIARNVWRTLAPILAERAAQPASTDES